MSSPIDPSRSFDFNLRLGSSTTIILAPNEQVILSVLALNTLTLNGITLDAGNSYLVAIRGNETRAFLIATGIGGGGEAGPERRRVTTNNFSGNLTMQEFPVVVVSSGTPGQKFPATPIPIGTVIEVRYSLYVFAFIYQDLVYEYTRIGVFYTIRSGPFAEATAFSSVSSIDNNTERI